MHNTRSPVDSPLSAGSFEWGYVPEAGQPSTADLIASQSQDFIDERLQEFQATIVQLQSKICPFFFSLSDCVMCSAINQRFALLQFSSSMGSHIFVSAAMIGFKNRKRSKMARYWIFYAFWRRPNNIAKDTLELDDDYIPFSVSWCVMAKKRNERSL